MQEATPTVKAMTATLPQKSKLIPPLAAVDPRKEPDNAAAARSRPRAGSKLVKLADLDADRSPRLSENVVLNALAHAGRS